MFSDLNLVNLGLIAVLLVTVTVLHARGADVQPETLQNDKRQIPSIYHVVQNRRLQGEF